MATPAGWYPDTNIPGGERFWDGAQWTEQRRDGAGRVPPPKPAPKLQPAGWYPDPELVNTRRYWDGAKWTDHRTEAPAATTPGTIAEAPGSSFWRWVGGIVVAIILATVALRFLYGGGLLDGSTTVDADDLATSITADLLEQDITVNDLECDDPGSVSQGGITYCRGTTDKNVSINIKVTFQSDGGYAWESM